MSDERKIKQLLWRCRRGTRELDLILGRFVENHYTKLNRDEQMAFDLLLDIEDPLLTEWLCLEVKPKDQGMITIVSKILSTDIA